MYDSPVENEKHFSLMALISFGSSLKTINDKMVSKQQKDLAKSLERTKHYLEKGYVITTIKPLVVAFPDSREGILVDSELNVQYEKQQEIQQNQEKIDELRKKLHDLRQKMVSTDPKDLDAHVSPIRSRRNSPTKSPKKVNDDNEVQEEPKQHNENTQNEEFQDNKESSQSSDSSKSNENGETSQSLEFKENYENIQNDEISNNEAPQYIEEEEITHEDYHEEEQQAYPDDELIPKELYEEEDTHQFDISNDQLTAQDDETCNQGMTLSPIPSKHNDSSSSENDILENSFSSSDHNKLNQHEGGRGPRPPVPANTKTIKIHNPRPQMPPKRMANSASIDQELEAIRAIEIKDGDNSGFVGPGNDRDYENLSEIIPQRNADPSEDDILRTDL